MQNNHFIQVFEHQVLRVDDKIITQAHLDALAYFDEQHQHQYFTLVHKGVRFRQYVGVLQVGSLTIEILPKTDQHSNNHQQWQAVLLELLHVCNFVKIDALSQAPLQLKTSPLLWLYLELFVQEVEQLLTKGLQKSYQKEEKNDTVWKGQILFEKHLKHNLTNPQRVYTAQQTYTFEHPIHQVLYQALQIVAQFWISPSLQNKVDYLLRVFPPQKSIKTDELLFQNLQKLASFKHYQTALDLAKMICLQYSPDVKLGTCPVLAILFDMNQLFEHFIYQQLRKTLDKSWKIKAQFSKPFWATKTLRPDIWLQQESKNYILDTKWKILQRPSPSDEDLRQMYAYNNTFQATQSLLIYPNVFDLTPKIAAYTQPIIINNEAVPHYCKVVFVNILNAKGSLNLDIAQDILLFLEK